MLTFSGAAVSLPQWPGEDRPCSEARRPWPIAGRAAPFLHTQSPARRPQLLWGPPSASSPILAPIKKHPFLPSIPHQKKIPHRTLCWCGVVCVGGGREAGTGPDSEFGPELRTSGKERAGLGRESGILQEMGFNSSFCQPGLQPKPASHLDFNSSRDGEPAGSLSSFYRRQLSLGFKIEILPYFLLTSHYYSHLDDSNS